MERYKPTVRPGFGSPAKSLLTIDAVLGKVEASPYDPPVEPYDPGLKINQKKFPNYLPWHAHITALTVAPASRRLGYATKLTEALEQAGDAQNAWFVDLFVRVENQTAIRFYKNMGYVMFCAVVVSMHER